MPTPLTFLFTDLENSTKLWDLAPKAMRGALARHDQILSDAIEKHEGRIVKTTGDGVHAVFESAAHGVEAALASQQALVSDAWPSETGPLKVRMGLHTGESQERDGDYYGPAVNEAARLMDAGHGGQVLLSEATALLVRGQLGGGVTLADLGRHRLKGLAQEGLIYQLCHPDLVLEFPPLKTLSVLKHNLRIQPTTFIGRKRELADLIRYLDETRLLTLLGPGGTGKTRLMLQAAEEVVDEYPDGVWLVELAPLVDPDQIPERAAAVLNVQEQPGRQILESVTEYLRRKELLLLLDNVEHLIRECATFAQYLLENCPKVKILVTGREALFIGGEITMQIPSLGLPDQKESLTLEEICAVEGVQLFLERTRSARPDFDLTPENGATIAEIVRRLDGIPLALELAAARMRMLSVEQIAKRLNDRFRLLTGGRRTALPRQQTLQALIDWSWNLLTESERLLLQRLSVFSGGWRLAAAEAVTSDERLEEYEVLDNLEGLINKSLVIVEHLPEGGARYRMLESIRQYARDRLFYAGEGEKMRDRHAEYFVHFAEEAAPHLVRTDMLSWMKRLVPELDNIRAVMSWTQEDRPELALRICGALFFYEVSFTTPREINSWLAVAIENMRPLLGENETGIRQQAMIKALIGLSVHTALLGKNREGLVAVNEGIERARKFGEDRLLIRGIAMKIILAIMTEFNVGQDLMEEGEEAIAIARLKGYNLELVWVLGAAAGAYQRNGDNETALALTAEAEPIAAKINNPQFNVIALQARSNSARLNGDLAEAEAYSKLGVENAKLLGSIRLIAVHSSDLAHIYRHQGKFEEAEALYRETIVTWQEQGHQSAIAHQLECFAYLAIAREDFVTAAKLLGAAQEGRRAIHEESSDPEEIADLKAGLSQLTAALGESEKERAMAAGRQMDLDEAVTLALAIGEV